jgi:hypothetical protein
MSRVKERAPILFFFQYFASELTFGSLKEFKGASNYLFKQGSGHNSHGELCN